jgi:hypothetical protein
MTIYGKNSVFPVENIQKLQVDHIYSYRELCSLLGEKKYGGDQKKAQMKKWADYFTLEPVGRKLKVVHIFNSKQFDNTFRKTEKHIANSAKLMLNYFIQNKDTFKQSETHPELFEKILFSSDIGITCGYLNSYYKDIKKVLMDKNRDKLLNNQIAKRVIDLQINEQVIYFFIREVDKAFYDLLKNLLKSLNNKDVMQDCRKVYIGINDDKQQVVLSESEEVQYNLILEKYGKEFHPHWKKIKTSFFSPTDRTEFNKKLKKELGYSKVYEGCYCVVFDEKTVAADNELSEFEQMNLQDENREHFKEKVVAKLETEKGQALKRGGNRTSSNSTFDVEDFLAGLVIDADAVAAFIHKMATEGVSTKPERDTRFIDNLFYDTETATKTTTDLHKLVDSFL